MFISIVVPVYNSEKYIQDCLDSCLMQNIPKNEYEIICINDGSTDNSAKTLAQYAATNENIIVKTKANSGVSSARNDGIKWASGDYIWFVDSDDVIMPNCLKSLMDVAKQTGCDELVFHSHSFVGNVNLEKIANYGNSTFEADEKFASPCWRLYRRESLGQLRFKEDLEIVEDQVFVREFYLCEHNTIKSDGVFYLYRMNENSVTHKRIDDSKLIERRIKAARAMWEIYNSKNGGGSENADILMAQLRKAMYLIAKQPKETASKSIKQLKSYNLYPLKILKESTVKNAYVTTRTDAVGKIFNWICLHSTTRYGYWLLRMWNKL